MAYNDHVLRYNSYGRKYEVPRRRVFSIYDLESGDHIAFHQFSGSYWHHAIVEYVFPESDEIQTIEYTNSAEGFLRDNSSFPKTLRKAQVVEVPYRFSEITAVYKMLHEYFNRHATLLRAWESVDESDYNLFFNNCEHFAMWCVTGISSSDQVNKAAEMLGEEVGKKLVIPAAEKMAQLATQSASHSGRVIIRSGAGRQLVSTGTGSAAKLALRSAPHAGRVIMGTGGPPLVGMGAGSTAQLAVRSAPHAGRVIMGAGGPPLVGMGAGSTAQLAVRSAPHAGRVIMGAGGPPLVRMGAGSTAQLAARSVPQAGRVIVGARASQSVAQSATSDLGSGVGGIVAGGAIAAVIEGVSIVHDIANVERDLNSGRIDGATYDRFVGTRLATGTGGVAGSTFGMVAGQMLIPIPFLGAAIGGVAGALFGRFAGNVAGTALFD